MKDFARQFYKSKEWQDCRESYAASKYWLCERCSSPGKIVHHKVLLTPANIDDPNVTLNWDNLELTCQTCHNQEHHGNGDVLADGLMFDADGNLVQR